MLLKIYKKYEDGLVYLYNTSSFVLFVLASMASFSLFILFTITLLYFIIWEIPPYWVMRTYFSLVLFSLVPFLFSHKATKI